MHHYIDNHRFIQKYCILLLLYKIEAFLHSGLVHPYVRSSVADSANHKFRHVKIFLSTLNMAW